MLISSLLIPAEAQPSEKFLYTADTVSSVRHAQSGGLDCRPGRVRIPSNQVVISFLSYRVVAWGTVLLLKAALLTAILNDE